LTAEDFDDIQRHLVVAAAEEKVRRAKDK